MVGRVSARILNFLTIGFIRWSTHEAPEKAKSEWQAPKEQTLSEVNWFPSLANIIYSHRSRRRSSAVIVTGLSRFLRSLRLQRQVTLSLRFGPVTKLMISSTGIQAGWS